MNEVMNRVFVENIIWIPFIGGDRRLTVES